MKYSELEIKNHLLDICKLQCFVNGEESEWTQIESDMRVSEWIVKYDFSLLDLSKHILEFYQIDENHRDKLIEILQLRDFKDLTAFIASFGIRVYDLHDIEKYNTDQNIFWNTFLEELGKKGVNLTTIRPSDEINDLLQNNLSNFVFALSRIAPGKIKSFSTSKRSKNDLFMVLLISLVLLEFTLLAFGVYYLVLILLIPLIVLGFIVFYLQRKSPEITYVNDYVIFQDMIDDIITQG